MASIYEFLIKDKAGNVVVSLDSTKSRSHSRYLNKPGDASFTVAIDDPKLTTDFLLLGDKELHILRAGVEIWGGELCGRNTTIDASRREAVVTAKGFADLLSKKIIGTALVPRIFTNTDAGAIAAALVNEAQAETNGDFGITVGSITPSKNRDRTLDAWQTVKDVIDGMCSVNIADGFDYEVSPAKQLNIYYPQGSVKADIVFEWGVNILGFTENMDATQMANQVIALGAGQGPATLTSTQNADGTIQAQYKIRKKTISHKDIITTGTLDDYANNELSQTQTQTQIFTITTSGDLTPGLSAYNIGDTVAVKIITNLFTINGLYRIYGIQVDISDEDIETVQITFNQ